MKKYSFFDLQFNGITIAGKQALMFFPNGYGASVIIGKYSYGGDQGLYELAVLKGNLESYCLTYSTPITEDVIDSQTPEEITELLNKIAALPGVENEA